MKIYFVLTDIKERLFIEIFYICFNNIKNVYF